MMTLFDMIAKAQNGEGLEALAKQFNLNHDEVQSAVTALLPAFSEGLKRNTADPAGIGSFLQALGSGGHARYFDDAAKAFAPGGVTDGNGILGHVFGSKDVSRAVASQAAAATGLGQDMLKQMLPVIAAMVMGGLFKQSTEQMSNPFGKMLENMMGGAFGANGGAQPKTPSGEQNPFQNPFGAGNPWGKMLEQMMQPNARAVEQPQPEPQNPLSAVLGNMFETGHKTQDNYQKGVQSIFDQYVQNMDRKS
jgi:hypothetical protein